jgi:hypothetical protein
MSFQLNVNKVHISKTIKSIFIRPQGMIPNKCTSKKIEN